MRRITRPMGMSQLSSRWETSIRAPPGIRDHLKGARPLERLQKTVIPGAHQHLHLPASSLISASMASTRL